MCSLEIRIVATFMQIDSVLLVFRISSVIDTVDVDIWHMLTSTAVDVDIGDNIAFIS